MQVEVKTQGREENTVSKRGRKALTLLALTTALTLVLGASLGCGSGGGPAGIVLPGGGENIGNLYAVTVSDPSVDRIAQGSTMTIVFSLLDANHDLPMPGLQVSFEVVGGTLPGPPTHSDENGQATVTFIADSDFVGAGLVRLIQPDTQLRHDVTFAILEPACRLTATVEDADGVETTTCGGPTDSVIRLTDERTVTWLIERPDPVTGIYGPVEGAYLDLVLDGFTDMLLRVGPSNADGEIILDLDFHPTRTGPASIFAEVVIPDDRGAGPSGDDPDGLPDAFGCPGCTLSFDVSNTVCDGNEPNRDELTLAVGYEDGAPLLPGQVGLMQGTVEVEGVPQEGKTVRVIANNGDLGQAGQEPDSGVPITVVTEADGSFEFTFRADSGFSGTEVITAEVFGTPGFDCGFSGAIDVETCALEVAFDRPVVDDGGTYTMTVTVANTDLDTIDGQLVALSTPGGFFDPPDAQITLTGNSGSIDFVPAAGASGTQSLGLSFVEGYPCPNIGTTYEID